MSGLAGKLRALRQQAGVVPAAPKSALASVPSVSPARSTDFARLLRVRQPSARRAPPGVKHEPLGGDEIAPGLRLTTLHTPWPEPPAPFDASFAKVPQHIDPARLVFFDTETTGLAGGTGTRAFMIGMADWHEGGFRVRQWLITTLQAETTMLEAVAAQLQPGHVLVSYNGKCYDAPLLATRYRLARQSNPFADRPHIDLLHPVRRRWRGIWANCRLATVERELLGVVREDDLPGSEAPQAWLDYLRLGKSDKLSRVGTHNAQDLRSLAGVLRHMVEPVVA
ncbi:ribonuclease H-like domain-containing protein [Dyella terrae]|uniref:Exonuclease n=2 Tax=Dyella TaxID=231454 RepID=A0A4R0YJ39_9GAMM|nr:ribonuclease H-like domain-containing protein [Dyella terrae]TBR36215.1 exonuclease [Dyella terrae]TCI05872.1 exonuclease [Dyella soli]